MDWTAAMSSEIFREYVKNELKKEAKEIAEQKSQKVEELDKEAILNDFENLECKIRNNPKLKQAFKIYKEKLASDSEYRSKVHPDFINGIDMLFLDSESDFQEGE